MAALPFIDVLFGAGQMPEARWTGRKIEREREREREREKEREREERDED